MAPTKNERLALALAKASCENEVALTRRLRTLQGELDLLVELLEAGDTTSAVREIQRMLESIHFDLQRAG